METVQLHECCVVAYRTTSSGSEFCLLTPTSENRWEFPKIALDGPDDCNVDLLERAASGAGLQGEIAADKPLGSYVASRQNETRSMTAFLMHVSQVDDSWPGKDRHRRLWCLAEEARVRIRRKPLRRFIDLALRSLKDQAADPVGEIGRTSAT